MPQLSSHWGLAASPTSTWPSLLAARLPGHPGNPSQGQRRVTVGATPPQRLCTALLSLRRVARSLHPPSGRLPSAALSKEPPWVLWVPFPPFFLSRAPSVQHFSRLLCLIPPQNRSPEGRALCSPRLLRSQNRGHSAHPPRSAQGDAGNQHPRRATKGPQREHQDEHVQRVPRSQVNLLATGGA